MRDSNPRLRRCKRRTLAAELIALFQGRGYCSEGPAICLPTASYNWPHPILEAPFPGGFGHGSILYRRV